MKVVIPAAVAPGREGLDLAATRLNGLDAERLLLTVGSGAVRLTLGAQQGEFVFAYGALRLDADSDVAGRAFVDEVARWLGLEPEREASPSEPAEESTNAETGWDWVRLGEGSDPFGFPWQTFKLFLNRGELYAEVFLRLSSDGRRAQLVEKWSKYRPDLVAILERALCPPPPRRFRAREAPVTGPRGEVLFAEHGALELALPEGWLLTRQPEGHARLADPEDEMMIEVSYLRLPPLMPGAPDVVGRVRVALGTEHADAAAAIATFERDGAAFAWTEHGFLSRDTKRPDAEPRPARSRLLIASNDWVQVLVTACWWDTDTAAGERAWDGVVESLRLGGRIAPQSAEEGDA